MVQITAPVEPTRAHRYRTEGLWDDRALSDGIEAGAALAPDTTALVDHRRSLTRGEVSALVAAATARLEALGIGPGTSAVLVTGNTAEGVIVYQAVLRSGALAVLLDRRCGPTDVGLAVDVCGRDDVTVICAAALAGRLLDGLGVNHVDLTDLVFGSPTTSADQPNRGEPDRNRPAMVVFTSGTTSRPKGVIHSLNTLTAGARNMAAVTGAGPATTVYLVSPLTSIAGVMQMHLCADQHAALVLDDHFDAPLALDRMRAHDVDLLGGAPVILERLLQAASTRGDRHIALRKAALGGAMLPMPLLRQATDEYGVEIVRVYGSSEAPNTTGSLPHDDIDARLLDDGALLPGTEVRVGSSEDPREGMLRGPALFLGYVDLADNDDSFEDGWYRTGDAVDVHDSRLTVVGRLKDIVNRSGLKISLAEIDEALVGLQGSAEGAAFGMPDPDTGERLVVAVRPDATATITLGAVLDHLRGTGLATRKLPEELVIWNDPLPRTTSGKIVRPRLARESVGRPGAQVPRLRAD